MICNGRRPGQGRLASGLGDAFEQLGTIGGWTQERLGEESGLHPTHVGDTERGERNGRIA